MLEKEKDPGDFALGPWTVHRELNRISGPLGEVVLERMAMDVLCFFLENPNRVVSTEELLEKVWLDRIVEPNSVHQRIHQLRRALHDDHRNPIYFETVPKRGYRLIAQVRKLAGPVVLAEPTEPTRSMRLHTLRYTLGFCVLVLLVAPLIWWVFNNTKNPTAQVSSNTNEPYQDSARGKSIAVLPFASLSEDPGKVYFAAGVHEEILNQLVSIKDLSVIARTTMLTYTDTDKTIPQIGAELNVVSVMEGTVRYADDRVRVTVQLIDVETGAHLWSQAFEEKLEDLFVIQVAIAAHVANTLKAKFSAAAEPVLADVSTNPEALAHYLRAVAGFGNFARTEPLHAAVNAALKEEPNFARALAFKAFLHAIEASMGWHFVGREFGADDQVRLLGLAEKFAAKALFLDPEQARAHWALSIVHTLNRRWVESQQSIERAYELNPSDYIIVNAAAWESLYRGEVERGIRLMNRAVNLAPGDLANQQNALDFFYLGSHWEAAKHKAEVLAVLMPETAQPFVRLAQIAAYSGDDVAMRDAAKQAIARSDVPQIELIDPFSRVGEHDRAQEIFDAISVYMNHPSFNAHAKAVAHLGIGQYEVALDEYAQAIRNGFSWTVARDFHYLSHHKMFDPIRDDPKFHVLIREAGQPLLRTASSGG